jgi:5-methyltetrahydropteroyltriglutamate--homocysteine methyltransferase
MKRSTDRILTTHVGSLPRPRALLDLLLTQEKGESVDPGTFDREAGQAVDDIVAQQVKSGIDVVSDGEMSKLSYTFYVNGRVNGIGKTAAVAERARDVMLSLDVLDHPDLMERQSRSFAHVQFPACVGPVSYGDPALLQKDIARFRTAVDKAKPVDAFLTCASPGVLTKFIIDDYYHDEDKYVFALAEAMRVEYEAVVAAGFVLQIDCPDLASARNNQYRKLSEEAFLRIAERNVEALNHATANIPSDAMRMHLCWGNYEGPHTHDIALTKVLSVAFKARPSAVSFEGANPRHAHEWEDLKSIRIPDDKVLIPGMLDSTTNFVEHPKLIAQHILHYADVVGRERVIAGADCGFSTVAIREPKVVPSVVWAKFEALAEGARLASAKLWSRAA